MLPLPDSHSKLDLTRARIKTLSGASAELQEVEARLRDLRAEMAETDGDLEARNMDWLRERQDAETHLQAYRERAIELRQRIGGLEEAGADAPCPTCGRILDDHLEDVLALLRDEWDSVVQDGRWWRRRRDQLEEKPPDVRGLEARSIRLHAEIERLAEQAERVRWSVRELEELREQMQQVERRARSAAPQAGSQPEG